MEHFEKALQRYIPCSMVAYREAELHRFPEASVDLGMFFRTGLDVCTLTGLRYRDDLNKKPRFALASSDAISAYALWLGDRDDWVVVTTGLIEVLTDLGQRVAKNIATLKQAKQIQENYAGLASVLDTPEGTETVGLCLAHMSFIFVVGHELGHHISGHEHIYRGTKSAAFTDEQSAYYGASAAPAQAEDVSAIDSQRKEFSSQAREMAADHIGVSTLLRHLLFLKSRFDNREPIAGNTPGVTRILEIITGDDDTLALMSSGSVLMALTALGAGQWAAKDISFRTHPFPAIRAYAMIELINSNVAAFFSKMVTNELWGPLSLFAVPLACQPRPATGKRLTPSQARRMVTKAWWKLGITKAVYRPNLMHTYFSQLRANWAEQRENCRSHWRIDDPEPHIS